MVPPPGVAAQFAFNSGGFVVFINSGVRTGADNGITSHIPDVPQRASTFSTTTIWGVPGDPRHNGERCPFFAANGSGEPCPPVGVSMAPLLSLPTSCGAPPEFTAEELGTWRDEHVDAPPARYLMRDQEEHPIGFTGCELLQPFGPEISLAPDTSYSDTPAGLSVDVKMPQGQNSEGLQTPGLKGAKVVLPEGLVINPGQANGLVACQPGDEQLGREPDGEVNEKAATCPAASKIGTAEVTTPTLPDKLQGNVYILQQNPPNLQILVAPSADGVNLKLVGDVHLNEQTGRLETTFENTPDLPFTDFKLNFSGGAQAALATPTQCGVYESSVDFTSWSSPFIEDALDSSRFAILNGPGGSACSPSTLPFAPSLTAGATTDQAGGFTNFSMLLQRGDGQQRIERLQFKAPPGLAGMISQVPLCPEPQAAQGTCPASSQIGHASVESGPGPYPLVLPQPGKPELPIYLTGPYQGAPFGLSVVTPVLAGPFDLGTIVTRGRIDVDPTTAQITVTTDPLPQLVKGVPTDLRLVNAVIDRPGFMFNPTNCSPFSFSGTAWGTPPPGAGGPGASAPIQSRFQVGSCRSLQFKPDFKVAVTGHNSKSGGAGLSVKLSYPPGSMGSEANIGRVKVELPKQLPSRLTTLQKACLAATFAANPASCPAQSIVGHAVVHTPLLPVPLQGPAIFVSHGGEQFPDLTIVLQGDGVTVQLVGSTFISKAGITSTTFKATPDVPFNTFELTLPQGPYSALAASTNVCLAKLAMPSEFKAQNGAELHQSTPIEVTGCPTTIALLSHRLHGRKLTLTVYVPAAGKLSASAKGLGSAARRSKGRETITLTLPARRHAKFKTRLKLSFSPAKGHRQAKTTAIKG